MLSCSFANSAFANPHFAGPDVPLIHNSEAHIELHRRAHTALFKRWGPFGRFWFGVGAKGAKTGLRDLLGAFGEHLGEFAEFLGNLRNCFFVMFFFRFSFFLVPGWFRQVVGAFSPRSPPQRFF